MFSKRSDLQVRVRYANPLPAPPFPPKLFDIPTDTKRFADPSYVDRLNNELPLPIVADNEGGMPLDLTMFPGVFNGDTSVLEPEGPRTDIHPDDQFLLDSFTAIPSNGSAQHPFGGTSSSVFLPAARGSPLPKAPMVGGAEVGVGARVKAGDVSWLRRTEYIGGEIKRRTDEAATVKPTPVVDMSRSAALARIEQTFEQANESLSSLKHPTKSGVTAIESYDILPDAETWATPLQLVVFRESPTDRNEKIADSRLEAAILRPKEHEGSQILTYYLPVDDETADSLKRAKRGLRASEDTAEGNGDGQHSYRFVRDYEIATIRRPEDELVLVLDDGNSREGLDVPKAQADTTGKGKERVSEGASIRRRAAYYNAVGLRTALRKKRATRPDTSEEHYEDFWHGLSVELRQLSPEELEGTTVY